MNIDDRIYFILILSCVIGSIFGVLLRVNRFCTMGAISDVVLFQDWTRAKQYVLAVCSAMIGTQTLSYFNLIDISQTIYTSNSHLLWLSHSIGGLCFGIGMVLSGGCVSQMLVRLGTGSLKALIVLMVMAISANMTLYGLLSMPRIHLFDTVYINYIHNNINSYYIIILLTLLFTLYKIYNIYKNNKNNNLFTFIFIQLLNKNNINVMIIGLITSCLLYLTGALNNQWGYILEHPDTLQPAFLATASHQMEGVSFVAPIASWLLYLMQFSDTAKTLTVGMMLSIGVVFGSLMVSFKNNKDIKQLNSLKHLDTFKTSGDLILHLIGGTLMGFGGVLGLGCSLSQGLTGLSLLSLGSLITIIAMIMGATLTLKILYHYDK